MSRNHPSQYSGGFVPKDLDVQLLSRAQACRRCVKEGHTPSANEREAQRRFYEGYNPLVQHFVAAFGMKSTDAEDCRQDAWVRILDRLPEFVSDGTQASLCCWIRAIVRSLALNLRRWRARHPTRSLGPLSLEWLPSRESGPAADYERHRCQERVHQVLPLLRHHLREISYMAFYKHWIEQKTVREIAEELNTNSEKTSHRLWKAMRQFRKLYERMDSDGGSGTVGNSQHSANGFMPYG